MQVEGRRIEIRGHVDGSSFPPWVSRLAREHHVAGRVRNAAAGVTIEAFAPMSQLDLFLGELERSAPAADIDSVQWTTLPVEEPDGFTIEPSPARSMALRLLDPDGTALRCEDPLGAAAAALRDGRIVAVNGLGREHLCCDATSSDAVQRLRERGPDDTCPFAVMVPNRAAASRIALLDDTEAQLLESADQPVVVVRRRISSAVCAEVAPGRSYLGIMLPGSPLDQLLTAEAGRPIAVTTDGRNDGPARRLADLVLVQL